MVDNVLCMGQSLLSKTFPVLDFSLFECEIEQPCPVDFGVRPMRFGFWMYCEPCAAGDPGMQGTGLGTWAKIPRTPGRSSRP